MTSIRRPPDRRYGKGCRLLQGYRSDKPHWNETVLGMKRTPRKQALSTHLPYIGGE